MYNATMRKLLAISIILACPFIAGCGTILAVTQNIPFPNQIYGGSLHGPWAGGHNVLDLPFSLIADTIVLPYTIPRTIYNCHHPEDMPKTDFMGDPVDPTR